MELASLHPYGDRDTYARRIAAAVAGFTMHELEARFDSRSIWWAPIKYYDELLEDPQVKHLGVFCEVKVKGRTIHLVNHPNKYDGQTPDLRVLALEIGEHTEEVLREAGYSAEDIGGLLSSKAVVSSRSGAA